MNELPFSQTILFADQVKARLTILFLDTGCLENEACFDRYLPLVSDYRREKTLKYRFPAGRTLSLGAGLVMEKALNAYGLHEKEMRYLFGEHEKPVLADFPALHFNLSHSGRMVMGCFSLREVGCDIQKTGEVDEKLIVHCFHPMEGRYLAQLPEEKRTGDFYRLWTLKESYIKLTGEGLSLSLKDFCILPGETGIRTWRGEEPVPVAYTEFSFPGYRASAAVFGPDAV